MMSRSIGSTCAVGGVEVTVLGTVVIVPFLSQGKLGGHVRSISVGTKFSLVLVVSPTIH